MPQRPVRRRVPIVPPSRPQPGAPARPRLVHSWAGWDAAVTAMIEERGPMGTRQFGQGQAENYHWILQGERCRTWRSEYDIVCPSDVTPEVIDSLIADLLGDAQMRPASVQQYVKNLKTFLRWCDEAGFGIEKHSLDAKNIKLGEEEPPDPFSKEELEALESAARTRARAFFVKFAWRTGLRVSEMARANV
jgi:site-specific recombinase XerD